MPPKKAEGTSAPRAKPTHGSYQDMITDAIVTLKDRNGSSRPKLKQYVKANNQINVQSDNMFDALFNKALRAGVEKGVFEQPKGPSGGTKLAKKAKVAATKVEKPKKAAVPKKKAEGEKKKAAPKKKAASAPKKAEGAADTKKAAPKKAAPKKAAPAAAASAAAAPKKAATKKAATKKDAAKKDDKPALNKTKTGRVTKKAAEPKKAVPKKAAAPKKKAESKKKADKVAVA